MAIRHRKCSTQILKLPVTLRQKLWRCPPIPLWGMGNIGNQSTHSSTKFINQLAQQWNFGNSHLLSICTSTLTFSQACLGTYYDFKKFVSLKLYRTQRNKSFWRKMNLLLIAETCSFEFSGTPLLDPAVGSESPKTPAPKMSIFHRWYSLPSIYILPVLTLFSPLLLVLCFTYPLLGLMGFSFLRCYTGYTADYEHYICTSLDQKIACHIHHLIYAIKTL